MSSDHANNSLSGRFFIKKTAHDVILEKTAIKWRRSSSSSSSAWDVTVQLRDVLCASGSDSNAESTPPNFSLHYICRNTNHKWRHETVTFLAATSSTTHDDIGPWIRPIQKYCGQQQRPQRLLVLINPVAGGGTGVRTYHKVAAPLFKLCDVKTDVIVTENGEHASKVLAKYDLSSVDGIVSVGGDGTFVQAFNGLLLRTAKDAGIDLDDPTQDPVAPSVPIGLIPAGTGEWMATNATWTSDPLTCTLHIVSGQRHSINMGSVHNSGRLVSFGTIVIGLGISAETIHRSQEWRFLRGARYLAAFIWTFIWGVKCFDAEIHFKPLFPQPEETLKGSNPQSPLASSDAIASCDTLNDGLLPVTRGWHIRKGSFSNLAMFLKLSPTTIEKHLPESLHPPKPYSAAMPLHQIEAAASVVSTLRELIGLGKEGAFEQEPVWGRQHDSVRVTHTLEYKVILDQDPSEDSYGWMNIDGESHRMEDRLMHVRFHRHLLPIFGTGLCGEAIETATSRRK